MPTANAAYASAMDAQTNAAVAQTAAAAAQTSATSALLKARANAAISKPGLIAARSMILAQGNVTPATAGGWRMNDTGGGVLSLDSTKRRRPGYDVTKVDATGTTGAVYKSMRIKTNPIVGVNGPIGIWVWTPEITAGGVTLNLRWSSDVPAADPPTATAANYYEMIYTIDMRQVGKWSFLSISSPTGKCFTPSQPNGIGVTTPVVGSPTAGTINQLEIVTNWNSATPAAERLIYIDCAEIGGKAKPMVVIGFDGANDDATSIGYKLKAMDKWGLLGYVAGDGNSIANAYASLKPFYDRGWDTFSQGMNHVDYTLPANTATLGADFDAATAVLKGFGFTRSLDCFAYPFNSRNLATDAILSARGVRLARAQLGNQRIPYNTTGSLDLLAVPACDIDNRTAAQIKAVIDEAVASGSHVFFYGHRIDTTGSSTVTVIAEWLAMIDYIGALHQAGIIEVVTPTVFADRLLA